MTNRRPMRASAPTGDAPGEDDLTRLIKTIARQAAQEAFNALVDALNVPAGHGAARPSTLQQRELEGSGRQAGPSPEPGERFLSVAAVAERLEVSEKWVRRKIASGDLPAHRVGRLVRVGELGLATYVARARLRKGQSK
jgi:excisionase family DNA binding protein